MKGNIDFFARGLSVKDVTEIIDQHVFSERDRRLLKRRLIDGIPYEELAEEFYLSVERARKIVKEYKHTIFNL